jgi:hypothetical protein
MSNITDRLASVLPPSQKTSNTAPRPSRLVSTWSMWAEPQDGVYEFPQMLVSVQVSISVAAGSRDTATFRGAGPLGTDPEGVLF